MPRLTQALRFSKARTKKYPYFGSSICGLFDFTRSVLSTNFWLGARSTSVLKVSYPGRLMEILRWPGVPFDSFAALSPSGQAPSVPLGDFESWLLRSSRDPTREGHDPSTSLRAGFTVVPEGARKIPALAAEVAPISASNLRG